MQNKSPEMNRLITSVTTFEKPPGDRPKANLGVAGCSLGSGSSLRVAIEWGGDLTTCRIWVRREEGGDRSPHRGR